MAAVHALYDMCSMPHYIAELRSEVKSVIPAGQDRWQYDTVKRLKGMDSFLKESLRFNQADARNYPFDNHSTFKILRS